MFWAEKAAPLPAPAFAAAVVCIRQLTQLGKTAMVSSLLLGKLKRVQKICNRQQNRKKCGSHFASGSCVPNPLGGRSPFARVRGGFAGGGRQRGSLHTGKVCRRRICALICRYTCADRRQSIPGSLVNKVRTTGEGVITTDPLLVLGDLFLEAHMGATKD